MLQSIVYKIRVLSPTELRSGRLDHSTVVGYEEYTQLNMHHLRDLGNLKIFLSRMTFIFVYFRDRCDSSDIILILLKKTLQSFSIYSVL